MVGTHDFLFILCLGVALLCGAQQCAYNYGSRNASQQVEVFWINMDKSVDRRKSMDAHLNQLGILHRRVRGISLDDIYFPEDILSTWNTYEAQTYTKEAIPSSYVHKETNKTVNFSHVMNGLVGRVKGNRLKEIGCTSSHLEAMRQAIFFNRTASPYALITEDDIFIPFNIDFEALVASAPKDFAILQLFNSNEGSMVSYWRVFTKRGEFWTENLQRKALSFWSTCAYLINREVLRPIIQKIAYAKNNKVYLTIVAGIEKPCRPKFSSCCQHIPGTSSYAFQHRAPCFVAPKGFQADSFLYAMNKTYVITAPIITNGNGGNESTFHQNHVEGVHFSAFQKQRGMINDMITGKAALPTFISLACKEPLPLAMMLKPKDLCNMPQYLGSANISYVDMPLVILQPFFRHRFIDSNYNAQHKKFKDVHLMNFTTSQRLYIPSDVADSWQTKDCVFDSADLRNMSAANLEQLIEEEDYEFVVSGLCGRKRSSFDDLVRVLSHLKAFAQAAEKYPKEKYVMVTESHGDLMTPFSVDLAALLATLPADAVMMKLFNADSGSIERYKNSYIFDKKMWVPLMEKIYDETSTKLYIVNLDALRNILPSIISKKYTVNKRLEYYEVKIIAGVHERPCLPSKCCAYNSLRNLDSFNSTLHPACVLSTFGVQGERFLWRLGPAYAVSLPLWTSVMTDYQQGQLHLQKSFQQHRASINQIMHDHILLPPYIKKICQSAVPDLD